MHSRSEVCLFCCEVEAVFNTVNAFVYLLFGFQGEHRFQEYYLKPHDYQSKTTAEFPRCILALLHALCPCIAVQGHYLKINRTPYVKMQNQKTSFPYISLHI